MSKVDNKIKQLEETIRNLLSEESPHIEAKKLHPDAKIPKCANPGQDLGYDIYALKDVVLTPGVPTMVETGIALELPTGWGVVFEDRSGMAAKGIAVFGGVIDPCYKGELKVLLGTVTHNIDSNPAKPNDIKAGDRIAQMLPHKSYTWHEIEEVETLSTSARGAEGFGSTGR